VKRVLNLEEATIHQRTALQQQGRSNLDERMKFMILACVVRTVSYRDEHRPGHSVIDELAAAYQLFDSA
jgi:hypothetical protein